MAYSELKRILDRRPFESVRLTTSDGRTFTVRHPDAFLLGKTLLIVQEEDDFEMISLLHIVSARVANADAA